MRPSLVTKVVPVAPTKPLTRRQWERQQIADAFMAFGLSIEGIASTIKGPRRWELSVSLKGRRVVSSLPEVQAALDVAWAGACPSREQLDRDWKIWQAHGRAARKLGTAAARAADGILDDVLRRAGA